MNTFLPEAWLGYAVDTVSGGFVVKICRSCPSCGQAIAEAKSSQLRIRLLTCDKCIAKQTDRRMGESPH